MTALISPLVGSLGASLASGLYGDLHTLESADTEVAGACCPPLPMMKEFFCEVEGYVDDNRG